MSALQLGTTGLSFAITAAETGGLIQSLEIRKTREKASVRDNDGDTCGVAYFDPSEEINFEFFPSGATGVAAASPGASVALANYTPSAGLVITEELTESRSNDNFRKMSVKAVVHPAITS